MPRGIGGADHGLILIGIRGRRRISNACRRRIADGLTVGRRPAPFPVIETSGSDGLFSAIVADSIGLGISHLVPVGNSVEIKTRGVVGLIIDRSGEKI